MAQRGSAGVAVVTGAAGGVGRAVVARLIAGGMTVAAVDLLSVEPTDGCTTFECDISDPDAVQRLASEVVVRMGSIDALVNCAGVGMWFERLGDLSISDWQRVINVNLNGCFYSTRAFLPSLLERRGAIVHMSSVHGLATAPGHGAYATAKAGLFGLTKATAVDYGCDGVRANCIVLGSVDAGMTHEYEREASLRGVDHLAIKPFLRCAPEAVAEVVRFLLSEDARFVNGAMIAADGGLLAWL